jgi:hypothetical protein
VKWLKRIDVLTEPYTGEFQTGHYIYEWADRPHEPVTFMRVRARVTDPAPGSVIPVGTCTVRGKAWSGTGPVTRVKLSFTGGGDWHPAQLESPRGPYQWQDWTFDWAATDVGRHTIRPGHRCRRQRPTGDPTLEPTRLRKQRDRSSLRRRDPSLTTSEKSRAELEQFRATTSMDSEVPCRCGCVNQSVTSEVL